MDKSVSSPHLLLAKNGRMEEWKNGRMEEWKNGRMEEWKHGSMEAWKLCRDKVFSYSFRFISCCEGGLKSPFISGTGTDITGVHN
ncbi:hypothetical protein I4R72_005193 [Salmonella enterica]|nr:hypothetical protein [Salmonella enterica]EIT8744881.1 hypothetical protein [Salmonella enterica]